MDFWWISLKQKNFCLRCTRCIGSDMHLAGKGVKKNSHRSYGDVRRAPAF